MSNNTMLNRLFTISTLQKLINNNDNEILLKTSEKYLSRSQFATNLDCIANIYLYMNKNYRNQYYYKNTILNKLLLGVHSINTTTALTEIPISSSKADFILINGKAVVYEIKTELDNLERLDSQINNYYKAFDHVCIVSCESNVDYLLKKYDGTSVGIYVLTKKNTLRRIKEPKKDNTHINYDEMFRILNKAEFESIIKCFYGNLPKVSPVRYYSECKEMFRLIPKEIAYKMFIEQLKTRNKITAINKFNNVPYELKYIAYFSNYNNKQYDLLQKFLVSTIGGY